MNYNTSQILNLENSNAGIPLQLIRDAVIDTICDNWGSDIDLAEAFISGTVDIAAESAAINESLSEAGCETRVDEDDVKKALAYWVEVETLNGNL
jgi:hypothetical protein